MNKIKKILVPVDFTETSETATLHAIELAKVFKADIFLIHIVEDSGYYFSVIPEEEPLISQTIQRLETGVRERMDRIKYTILKTDGLVAEVVITSGKVDAEIIEFAQLKEINLIVMGTHGVTGYTEVFMGSNAQRVVTLSEVPVLTMQAGKTYPFKNLLIPIDNSLHSREKVNIAVQIAKAWGSQIHLLGLPDSDEQIELDKFNIKMESVEKFFHAENLPFKSSFEHGDNLAEVALNYSNKNNCDLIVINTGHESETTGIFMGALAQQIVNHSKTPVLSVKPTEGIFSITTSGYGIT